jgi:hypothetical protein
MVRIPRLSYREGSIGASEGLVLFTIVRIMMSPSDLSRILSPLPLFCSPPYLVLPLPSSPFHLPLSGHPPSSSSSFPCLPRHYLLLKFFRKAKKVSAGSSPGSTMNPKKTYNRAEEKKRKERKEKKSVKLFFVVLTPCSGSKKTLQNKNLNLKKLAPRRLKKT